MSTYNGVVGMDEPALNTFITSVYQAVHDEVLVGQVPIELDGVAVTSVEYDIASVPRVRLQPEPLVAASRRDLFSALGLQDAALAEAASSPASFGMAIETLTLRVHFQDGAVTVVCASVRAGLEVVVETDGNLTVTLVTLVIDVPDNPALSDIINHGLVPELMDLIGQRFLAPIRVPPLGLGAAQVSPPAVAIGSGRVLATTALLPELPGAAPTSGNWPTDTVFAGFDAPLLNAVVNQQLAAQVFRFTWDRTFKILSVSVTVRAAAVMTVSDVALEIVPGQDGQLRGTAKLAGTVGLKVSQLPTFSATFTSLPTARASVFVAPGNELRIDLDTLEDVDLEFDFVGVPPLGELVLDLISDALGPAIVNAAQGAVAGLPAQPLTRIPSIPVTVQGRTVVITLRDLDVGTLSTPDGKTLLALTGGADVQPATALDGHSVRSVRPHAAATTP